MQIIKPEQLKPHAVEITSNVALSSTKRKITYIVRDEIFPDFEVYESANAWWMDSTKVFNLILAFKQGVSVKTALSLISISQRQWEYFNQVHQEFCGVFNCCRENLSGIAWFTIRKNLTNPQIAKWYLEKTDPRFSKRTVKSRFNQRIFIEETRSTEGKLWQSIKRIFKGFTQDYSRHF